MRGVLVHGYTVMHMARSKQYRGSQSKSAGLCDGHHGPSNLKKSLSKKDYTEPHRLVLLILSTLTPICLTVCFLAVGMGRGQVMVNLKLKIASYFELETGITKVIEKQANE